MKQYIDLLNTIQKKGTHKPAARENMPGTQSLFGHQFRHDLSDGFPALTTKKIFWKGVVIELLWFLRGDTNIKYLVDNGVNFWNEDAYSYYCKTHKSIIDSLSVNDSFVLLCKQPISFDEFVVNVKNSKPEELKAFERFNVNYSYGDCGFQYGRVWRTWEKVSNNEQSSEFENKIEFIDQIKNLINQLKNNPESRRHIITAIDPAHDTDLALYWCHALFQFNCRPLTEEQRFKYWFNNKKPNRDVVDAYDIEENKEVVLGEHKIPKYYLDCHLYQRSCDVFLGGPMNIASYSLLIHIFSKMFNMIPGDFIHSFGDVHIYDNHKDAVEEQLKRIPTKLPTLSFSEKFEQLIENYIDGVVDFDSVILQLSLSDFLLENYTPQALIKAELSTGIKK